MAATRVAVVDDDRAVRDLLETLLCDEGYAVTPLAPDPTLLTDLVASRPSAIVLDWQMDEANEMTFDVIRADARLRSVPLLICTGDLDGMRQHAPRLATQPHVAIVEKPFQIDVLLAVLERLAAVSQGVPRAEHRPTPTPDALRAALARRGVRTQARAVLREFRATGGWGCAELWLPDRGLLRCVEGVASAAHAGFVSHSRGISLVPGFGLPGRVWVSERSAWIPDVQADRNFPRAPAARRFGVRAGVGVPVWLGGALVAVVCVYGIDVRPNDAGLLGRLERLASGLGPWIASARGELLRPDAISAAARRLAHTAARMADVAAVDLLNGEGALQRMAVAHRDPAMVEVAQRLEAFSPAPEGPVARAVESRSAQRLAVSDATLRRWSGSPEHLLVLRALRLTSLVSVPLIHGDRVIGGLTLSSADPAWYASPAASAAVAALITPEASAELGRLLARRRS